MTSTRLHPDWPEATLDTDELWTLPAPLDDLAEALKTATYGTATAPSQPTEPVALTDIHHVARYAVSWHSDHHQVGTPVTADESGTELELTLTAQLHDGRWISLTAWNDYTGWACRDGAEVRIGDTLTAVVEYGLDQDARRRLGYEPTP